MASQVATVTKKAKEQLKSLGLADIGDTSAMKINGIGRQITGISNKFKQLKGQRGVLGDVFDAQRFKQQAEEINKSTNKVQESISSFKKYNSNDIQGFINNYTNKTGTVKKSKINVNTTDIKKAKTEVEKLNSNINKTNNNKIKVGTSKELQKSNTFANRLKNAIQQVKKQMDSSGSSSKKISNGLSSAKNMASKMGGSLKIGLGQIMKIAGALFGLQTIYSTLTNVANTWLSSQNSQAKQLSANIDYMKYALGSTLAPVIQWIVNLIYQALKGVQSLIYALTGVNIFANASAKAYSNMAGSAKKAKEETKQLAGIHDEINNIQDNNSSDGGSGTGDISPNIDLSEVNTKLNDFLKMLKEGKWYEAGAEIGKKINESLEKIPWESIKKKAGDIGKGIAEFLNGGIATTDWKLVGKTLAEGINTAIEFAYSFITTFDWKKFGQSIGDSINGFFENIDWKKAGETIGKGISGIVSTISEFIRTVNWSAVAQSIFDFLIESISNIDWSNIISTIFYLLGLSIGWQLKIGQIVSKWAEELGKQVRKHFSKKIKEAGGNVAKGLWNGILEGLGNIGKWILDNIVNPIIDGFKNAMGIHSPSTVMAGLGKNVIEGLIKGITDKVSDLETKVKEICDKVKDWFDEKIAKSKFIQNGEDTIEGIKDGIKNNSLFSTVTTKCDEVKTWFKEKISSSKFIQNGKNVIEGIKSGMQNNSTFSTITSKCDEIKTWFSEKIAKSKFIQNGKDAIEGIKDGMRNNSTYTTISNICGNVRTWFSNSLASWNFTNIGKNVVEGIKRGMNSVSLASTAAAIGSSIATSFRRSLDIHSPSRVMRDSVGKFIPLGIAEGIKNQAQSVYDSVYEITNGLKLDKQGLVMDMSLAYSGTNMNSKLINGASIIGSAISDSDIGNNSGQPIRVQLMVGTKMFIDEVVDGINEKTRRTGKAVIKVGD